MLILYVDNILCLAIWLKWYFHSHLLLSEKQYLVAVLIILSVVHPYATSYLFFCCCRVIVGMLFCKYGCLNTILLEMIHMFPMVSFCQSMLFERQYSKVLLIVLYICCFTWSANWQLEVFLGNGVEPLLVKSWSHRQHVTTFRNPPNKAYQGFFLSCKDMILTLV